MDEKELKELLNKVTTEVSSTISEKQKDLITKEEMEEKLNSIHEQIKGNDNTELKEQADRLEKALTEQGETLQSLKEQGNGNVVKSLNECVFDSMNNDAYKLFAKNGRGNMDVFKAVGDMSSAGNLSGTYPVILPDRRREPIEILNRPMFMREIMRVGTTIKDKVDYVKEANREGTPAMATEVAASAQIDFDLVESVALVERLAAHLIVSRNMLDDIPYLSGLISSSGIARLMTVEDTQILSGNGTSPQLDGIITNATAFAAGNFENAVADATRIDVLRVAANQLKAAYYRPSYILLNPEDLAFIDVEKDSTGQYVSFGARYESGQPSIWRVPVFETTAITAGDYLIGDFENGVELLDRRQLEISMTDSHASIFTTNQIAIRLEERLAMPIYRNEAFITGTFADDIIDITA